MERDTSRKSGADKDTEKASQPAYFSICKRQLHYPQFNRNGLHQGQTNEVTNGKETSCNTSYCSGASPSTMSNAYSL